MRARDHVFQALFLNGCYFLSPCLDSSSKSSQLLCAVSGPAAWGWFMERGPWLLALKSCGFRDDGGEDNLVHTQRWQHGSWQIIRYLHIETSRRFQNLCKGESPPFSVKFWSCAVVSDQLRGSREPMHLMFVVCCVAAFSYLLLEPFPPSPNVGQVNRICKTQKPGEIRRSNPALIGAWLKAEVCRVLVTTGCSGELMSHAG